MQHIPSHILGDVSIETFLAEYWQQKPLLIRNAWPDFDPDLEPEELAGLALEPNIESRIVIETPSSHNGTADTAAPSQWALHQPPFSTSDFTELPPRCWTLLVNDVEKHLPSFRDFLRPFSFIPNWRIDDLMISYAAPGGSVGPHIDAYDVFLLQAYGQRHWHISTAPVAEDNFLPDTDLRILRDFSSENDWVLNPGDMLYLPPNIAHHGIAVDRCMTYSIGFRAPSDIALLDSFVEQLYDNQHPPKHLQDAQRAPATNAFEISEADIGKLRAHLHALLDLPEANFRRWAGKTLSAPRKIYELADTPLKQLQANIAIRLRPSAVVSYAIIGEQKQWFIDGTEILAIPISEPIPQIIDALLEHQPIQLTETDLQAYPAWWQALHEASLLVYDEIDD